MNRRQLTFQTCTQGWCWCTPPRSERTARPAALLPPGGGGGQVPSPPPPHPAPFRQLIGSNASASGAPGALSPRGATGRALVGGDFGCLPPLHPPPPQRIIPSGHANEGTPRGEGGGGSWPRGGRGPGEGRRRARLGDPDRDVDLKDFRDGLGRRRQAAWHLPRHRGPCHPGVPRVWSPGLDERAHVHSSSSTSGSSCALQPAAVGKPGAAAA